VRRREGTLLRGGGGAGFFWDRGAPFIGAEEGHQGGGERWLNGRSNGGSVNGNF
jgi:hypothetical protein